MIQATQVRDAAAILAGIGLLIAAVHSLPSRLTQAILDSSSGHARLSALDGLRAFLALGVVVTHAWSYHDYYYRSLPWKWPVNPYFAQCGDLAVPIFFMITGYLFWTKARLAGGRIKVWSLYKNRARRILPLYYFLCACVVVVALVRPHLSANSPGQIASEMAGLVVPGYHTAGPFAGTEISHFLAPAWTLRWEVGFYLVLPLVGLFAGTRLRASCFLVVVLALAAAYRVQIHVYQYSLLSFWVGFVVSELLERHPVEMTRLRGRALAVAAVLGFFVLPLWTQGMLGVLSFAYSSVVFAAVASGNDIFGILALRGTRLLGIASYSIYLLHMAIVATVLREINEVRPLAGIGNVAFCVLVTAIMFVVAAASLVSCRFMELPWLRRRPAL